jgi:hypothetical protein
MSYRRRRCPGFSDWIIIGHQDRVKVAAWEANITIKRLALSDEMIEAFMGRLRQGMLWSDGLVGPHTFRYRDGRFVIEGREMREPDEGPYLSSYTEDEFRALMRGWKFPDFAHRGLVRELSA